MALNIASEHQRTVIESLQTAMTVEAAKVKEYEERARDAAHAGDEFAEQSFRDMSRSCRRREEAAIAALAAVLKA